MRIYMPIEHFREDDRITITYANGKRLGYSVTLHARSKMILKGGDRTYNCKYSEHMWYGWGNSKSESVLEDEPGFVLEEHQRILEIRSANGKIVYRRNKMRLKDVLRNNTAWSDTDPSIIVTVCTDLRSYKGFLRSTDYGHRLVEEDGKTTIEFNAWGEIERSVMMEREWSVAEVMLQIKVPDGYYDLRNNTQDVYLSGSSVIKLKNGEFMYRRKEMKTKISGLLGEVKTVMVVNRKGEHKLKTGKITKVCLSHTEGEDGEVVSEIKSVKVGDKTLDKGTITILESVEIDYSDKWHK